MDINFAGYAGQRCMAASVLLLIGEWADEFFERIVANCRGSDPPTSLQNLKAGSRSRMFTSKLHLKARFPQNFRSKLFGGVTAMSDPFLAYSKVQKLLATQEDPYYERNDEKSGFQYDFESAKASTIRQSFPTIHSFAIGGTVQATDHMIDAKYSKEWIAFFLQKTIEEVKEEELESKLQGTAIKELLKAGSLPIEAILDLATPAPFGKNEETVVDAAVRNALEISAEKLKLGPFAMEYPECEEIEVQVEKNLRPPNKKWSYKLYKMHIYCPGGKFLPHMDTLHDVNHVATVVVSLPSEYEGGALVVKHNGQKVSFDLSNGNASEAKYCAFYTDCEHEVEEVISGYRVVLQYDVYESEMEGNSKRARTGPKKESELIQEWMNQRNFSGSADVCAPKNDGLTFHDFTAAVRSYYDTVVPTGDRLAILLEHRYSMPSLQASFLKGSDVHLYNALVQEWKCEFQALVIMASTDYEGEYQPMNITPVSMADFGGEKSSEVKYDGNTHLVSYQLGSPAQCLRNSHYIEYTGNEAQPGHLAYYACCVILVRHQPVCE